MSDVGDGNNKQETGKKIPPAEPLVDDTPAIQAIRSQIMGTKEELPSSGAGASMAPEAAAGVLLSKFVLAIVAATILMLLMHLFSVASAGRAHLGKVYDQVYLQVRDGTTIVDPARVDALITALDTSAKTEAAASDALASDMRALTAGLVSAKLATDRQKAVLDACVPFPRTERATRLADCSDLLRTIRIAAASASANVDKLRLLTEFAKTVDEQQRGYQAFWLQVAQLLLLNLLLPLLTGLFGYIFGTQGSRKANG